MAGDALGSEGRGLAEVLTRIQAKAAAGSAYAAKFAERNHYMAMGFGVLAILLSGLAGIGGGLGWPGGAIVIFGFLGAFFAGLQTFLNPEAKARFHWTRMADFNAVALDAQILATETNPTRADVTALGNRLGAIEGRQLGNDRPAP